MSGHDWKVSYEKDPVDDDGEAVLGLCQSTQQVLTIATKQTPIDTRDTLLHEVFHAILHRQGRTYGEEVEELYVNSLATGLVGVLQDNPAFAQWLIHSLNK